MSSNPNWKNEPFSSIEEWKEQCRRCSVVRDGDTFSFSSNDGTIGCNIISNNGKELYVNVGYFFPEGLESYIKPNCGWTH